MTSKSRRGFLALLPMAAARAAQRFGAVNVPQCANCHTPFPPDAPVLLHWACDADAKTPVILTETRELICQSCGVVQIAAP